MKPMYSVVWAEKYGDEQNPKTRWHRVGTLFVHPTEKTPEGAPKMSMKIESIPVNFDGWCNVFINKKKEGSTSVDKAKVADGMDLDPNDLSEPIDLSEIPF